jgi:NTP pyrophosphatase (non-canonical NTP hydrolase)
VYCTGVYYYVNRLEALIVKYSTERGFAMTDLQSLQQRLTAWHAAKFKDGVTSLAHFIKATEELGEVAKAILDVDIDSSVEEAADVVIALWAMVHRQTDKVNLFDAVEKKLAENERRLKEGK